MVCVATTCIFRDCPTDRLSVWRILPRPSLLLSSYQHQPPGSFVYLSAFSATTLKNTDILKTFLQKYLEVNLLSLGNPAQKKRCGFWSTRILMLYFPLSIRPPSQWHQILSLVCDGLDQTKHTCSESLSPWLFVAKCCFFFSGTLSLSVTHFCIEIWFFDTQKTVWGRKN